MVSRRTNFGERSEPAPGRGGKLQSAGGRHKVKFRHWVLHPPPPLVGSLGPVVTLCKRARNIFSEFSNTVTCMGRIAMISGNLLRDTHPKKVLGI